MRSRSGLRRTSSVLAVAFAAAALAQNHRPLPAESPDALVARAVPVHVVASDELEPDVLRALAKPGVTLWLTTRSNTVRESTVETLTRFSRAWVQLRPPLKAVDLKALERAPAAGLWLQSSPDVEASVLRFRGRRPLALDVTTGFDESQAELVRKLKPDELRWSVRAPDVLEWSLFSTAPAARHIARLEAGSVVPQPCSSRATNTPSAQVHVATLLAMSTAVFPCGAGTRVELPTEAEPWLLKSLVVRDPSVELVLRVSDDVRQVGRARLLLEALGR